SMTPVGSGLLALDADGTACSSDYYLRLTADGGRMLKGQIALTPTRPTQPVVSSGTSTVVSLRAHANGKYVTAETAGAAALIANRTAIGPWEQFDLLDVGNGNIALRAHANNMLVCADNAGASPLIANRTAVGSWETFALVHNADGSVSLRAAANNSYVTAENAGASSLIANRTAIGGWESFDLITA
ncbi:MAG: lectin, partial [Catenulispora sp.]|nr:lectin [Catenulispora sp.]